MYKNKALSDSTLSINSETSNLSDDSIISCLSPMAKEYSPPQQAIIYKELNRSDIEKIIGMKPIDINKYRKAFVHKSVVKNAKECSELPEYMKESYERYEFLGDSVLNLVVAKYLFNKYPNSHEGNLTKIRTKLVNGKTLAKFATILNLNEFLILNYKVENINGRTNNRILEDVFESLICSINLDLGFSHAEKFILTLIEKHINFDEILIDDNFKDILLRFCQNKFGNTPTYTIVDTSGPPHNRSFKTVCCIDNIEYKYGRGKNKKEAEQISARETLKHFKIID
jgi:ribonuclease-3